MGHLMRCIAIAKQAISKGHCVLFIGQDIPEIFKDLISSEGCLIHSLLLPSRPNDSNLLHGSWLEGGTQQDAEATKEALISHFGHQTHWLIVDHYGIDASWEKQLKDTVKAIAVIDDLADRTHTADILLDQNIYHGWIERYQDLTPSNCKLLIGSKYILIRDEFLSLNIIPLHKRQRDLVLFMGGGDENNHTGKVLHSLKSVHMHDQLKIDVILGPINKHKELIDKYMAFFPKGRLYVNPPNIAEIYSNAKLAIGAPGGSTWERCCVAIPSILIPVAENQKKVSQLLEKEKIAFLSNNALDAVWKYSQLKEQAPLLQQYANRARQYVDGQGVIRFIEQLEKRFEYA